MFLLIAFVCNAAMVKRPGFAVLLGLQSLFYSMAIVGYWLKQRGKSIRILSGPLHFCSMNLALVLGLIAYLRGHQGLVWDSTPRRVTRELEIDNLFGQPARAVAGMSDALDRPAA